MDCYRFRVLRVEVDVDRLVDAILLYERRGVWIQYVPCSVVVSERALRLAVVYAIRSFYRRRNISRKLNLEVLLRLFGRTQVREVLEILNRYSEEEGILVFLCSNPDQILNELVGSGVVRRIVGYGFAPDVDVLMDLYGLSRDVVERQAEVRDVSFMDALECMIIERMAVAMC